MNMSELYSTDETAWLDSQAELIGQGKYSDLDLENLKEFLEAMAGNDRRRVKSHLIVLVQHILKWERQPEGRSGSWKATIFAQQDALEDDVAGGSLRRYAVDVLPEAYRRGVRLAAAETGLRPETFPTRCPWTLDELITFAP